MAMYDVSVRSKPGMWERYAFAVRVFADDEQEARTNAIEKLRNGAFSDRGYDAWIIEGVERLG